jgi:hypothetical protein
MGLVVSVSFLPPATASLSPRSAHATPGSNFPKELLKEASSRERGDELVITDQTEIKVDGQASKYEEVPKEADIILLEVAADKKAILRIHFQTKK